MSDDLLHHRLRAIRQSWPHGGTLIYRVHPDGVHIERLTVPLSRRSSTAHTGSTLLDSILAATDAAQVPVTLHARATGRPTDPPQDALERWYVRHGFVPVSEEEEGMFMIRDVGATPTPSVDAPDSETMTSEPAASASASESSRARSGGNRPR